MAEPDLTAAIEAAMTAIDVADLNANYLRGSVHDGDIRTIIAAAAPLLVAAAADALFMPYRLGDEGWETLARQAEDSGYDRKFVDQRRKRDDFTTSSIEAAYQYGYRETLRRLGSKEWNR